MGGGELGGGGVKEGWRSEEGSSRPTNWGWGKGGGVGGFFKVRTRDGVTYFGYFEGLFSLCGGDVMALFGILWHFPHLFLGFSICQSMPKYSKVSQSILKYSIKILKREKFKS